MMKDLTRTGMPRNRATDGCIPTLSRAVGKRREKTLPANTLACLLIGAFYTIDGTKCL